MKAIKITCCISLIMLSLLAKAQKNLVTNSGFEDELYGWSGNNLKLTPWDFKTGKNSCAIISTTIDNWMGTDQVIRIPKKNTTIEFGAWIKVINVVKGKNDWDGAIFSVVFMDSGDKEINGGENIARLTGDLEWTLFTKAIKIPEKASNFKILLAMGNASGTMIIDDVTAKIVADQLAVK